MNIFGSLAVQKVNSRLSSSSTNKLLARIQCLYLLKQEILSLSDDLNSRIYKSKAQAYLKSCNEVEKDLLIMVNNSLNLASNEFK